MRKRLYYPRSDMFDSTIGNMIVCAVLSLSLLSWPSTSEAGAPGLGAPGSGVPDLGAAFESRIARADVMAGEQHAALCLACHSVKKGEAPRVGPNLWGVIGRKIASAEGYKYSTALRAKTGVWDYKSLDAFLQAPAEFAPGTTMVLPGIADTGKRANLIRFLTTLSDVPPNFDHVKSEKNMIAERSEQPVSDPFGADWPDGKGRVLTGNACMVCHSLAIVKQQGQTRAGWDEIIDWMIDEQGMRAPSSEDRDIMLDYLSTHFTAD